MSESDCRRGFRRLAGAALLAIFTAGRALAGPEEAIGGQIARLADPAAVESVRTELTTNFHSADVIPKLVTAITSDPVLTSNAEARQAAYEILGQLHNEQGLCADPMQADQLVLGLKDSDPAVADVALRALAKLDPAVSARAVEPLTALLADPGKAAAAAAALGQCREAEAALPKLEELLREDDAAAASRAAAAQAIVRIRRSPGELMPLVESLDAAGKDAAAAGVAKAFRAGVGTEPGTPRAAWLRIMADRAVEGRDDDILSDLLAGTTTVAKANNLTDDECAAARTLLDQATRRSADEIRESISDLEAALQQACP